MATYSESIIESVNPKNNFMPSPGKISEFHIPGGPGVRVDTHIYQDYSIPSHYDSMIAKLICYGDNREETINITKRALDEFIIGPIKTTIPFYKKIFNHPKFLRGEIYTTFVEKLLSEQRK